MKERPILFSGPMVRAILEGRKTQTRRVEKPQPVVEKSSGSWVVRNDGKGVRSYLYSWPIDGPVNEKWVEEQCPYGKPGDRLWVKECFRPRVSKNISTRGVEYRADGSMQLTEHPNQFFHDVTKMIPLQLWHPSERGAMDAYCDRWRPSIHMPRWASRLTLEITGVRVERLQSISRLGAIAEGCRDPRHPERGGTDNSCGDPEAEFIRLWYSINGGASWAANAWVWVVDFRRVEA